MDEFTGLRSRALIDGFSHDIPYISNVPINKLIELRQKEGEAFEVYRDALNRALMQIDDSSVPRARQVFSDTVLPELHKINNAIKNSRKLLKRSIAQELLLGAGFIGIGLFSGLVPATFGECLAAVGGYSFITGIANEIKNLATEPPEIRENSYYFLWKIQKQS
ncbi:MAG: hypothetical protein NTW99_14200 [Chloroflexi bacterium]|nr:hypothetical protein [Chloroflexota bacterium]